jgi:hypothetical protein
MMGIFKLIKTPKTAEPSSYRDPFFPSAGAVECEDPHLQEHYAHSSGLYVCCCEHENALNLRAGKSPFLYLTCGKCGHILCSECLTSNIIAPFDGHKWFFGHDLYDLSKHELFQACANYGLSSRV